MASKYGTGKNLEFSEDINGKHDTGRDYLSKIPQGIRDSHLARKFIENLDNPSSLTILGYSHDLAKFGGFLETGEFAATDRDTIRRYKTWLDEQGLMRNSVRRYLASLSAFFHYLVDEGMMVNPPIPKKLMTQRGDDTKKSKLAVSVTMVDALLAAPLINLPGKGFAREMALRDAAILQFLYKTGVRNSELRNIRLADISLTERRCKILGKGRKTRFVVFDDEAKEALEMYLESRKDGDSHLFRSRNGEALSLMSLVRMFRKYAVAANLPDWATPHSLRHTLATRLLERGANVKFISEFLGHSSVKITLDVYSHISEGTKKEMYDAIKL